MAGLSAAWTLREHAHEVMLLEQNEDAGGRCRAFKWNGMYLQRGAGGFIGSEENLIELATALGIYDTLPRSEFLENRPRYHVVHTDKGIVSYDDFNILEAIKSPVIPAKEKLALGRVVPRLLKQMAACDPRDPVTAADFDDQNACAYFREYSPAFVNYFLEPSLSFFCGYGEEDYSLAWLLWLIAGRLTWGAERTAIHE